MIMIIFIHKKGTLQIITKDNQQSPNLRMPVENYKYLIEYWIYCQGIKIFDINSAVEACNKAFNNVINYFHILSFLIKSY